MNPNLSPNSKSTESQNWTNCILQVEGKEQVLFKVDERISSDAVIDVAALIQKLQQ